MYRLQHALGQNMDLKELFSQKKIIIHIITFAAYSINLVIFYGFFSVWDEHNVEEQNRVYIVSCVSSMMLFIAMTVMLVILSMLGTADKEPEADEKEEKNQQKLKKKNKRVSDASTPSINADEEKNQE